MNIASSRERVSAFMIDALGYLLLMMFMLFVVFLLTISPMGSYSDEEQRRYFFGVLVLVGLFFVQHVLFHQLLNASLGQFISGLHYVSKEGDALNFRMLVKRSFVATAIFPSLILLPGPIVGFIAGPSSAVVSMILLLFGFAIVSWLSLGTDCEGRNFTERLVGWRLVRRK